MIKNSFNNVSLFLISGAIIAAGYMVNSFDQAEKNPFSEVTKKVHIAPENDDRISLPVGAGSPYESIGIIVGGLRGTVTDIGNNTGLTVIHNIGDIQKLMTNQLRVGFGCATTSSCQKVAYVTEVALLENYVHPKENVIQDESHGYDFALVRFTDIEPSKTYFSVGKYADIESVDVKQAGYSYDSSGLTGDFSCQVIPPFAPPLGQSNTRHSDDAMTYTIRTDCMFVPGDSGSPVFNQQNEIIGTASNVYINEKMEVVETLLTPITAELKRVIEDFKDGKSVGTSEILPNGLKVTKIPYQRQPISYPENLFKTGSPSV